MPIPPEIEALKNKLNLERTRFWQAVEQLSGEERERPAEDGWSARDIVAHVGLAEQINVDFARLAVELDNPEQLTVMADRFPDFRGPFSLDRFNAFTADRLRELTFDRAVQRAHEVRAATLAWLETLTAEQLERRGRHAAWGEQSVRSLLRILALHDKMHTQDLQKRLRE